MIPSPSSSSQSMSSPEGPRNDTGPAATKFHSPRSRKYSTKLACTFCRKKRTKCDGNSPCSHCRAHQKDCVYEKTDQQTKSSLRGEVDSLRRSLHMSNSIIEALRDPQHWDFVVKQLQAGATNDQVAEMLRVLRAGDAVPQEAHVKSGHQHGTMTRIPDSDSGSSGMAMDMPGRGLWSDTGESELLHAPRYDDATLLVPHAVWNPLFFWPADTVAGALLPWDLDATGLPDYAMGPASGPPPGI